VAAQERRRRRRGRGGRWDHGGLRDRGPGAGGRQACTAADRTLAGGSRRGTRVECSAPPNGVLRERLSVPYQNSVESDAACACVRMM